MRLAVEKKGHRTFLSLLSRWLYMDDQHRLVSGQRHVSPTVSTQDPSQAKHSKQLPHPTWILWEPQPDAQRDGSRIHTLVLRSNLLEMGHDTALAYCWGSPGFSR